ncbi:PREDICTED: NADH dehydrogenase (ubiquinone) complex I, assembly factor 6 isoform X2 [Nicrophorus vespilloides]|nr:PREDICTED: NADH dehydrogenase (ubiquinone) complex I, assembly factor 6 isoform X2 [Nicrophorus vespilloides]
MAVRGFNIEVSRVAEQTSQPSIGLMRLKFWEDTIDKCYQKDIKNVPQHPIAIELFKAVHNRKLTKRYFNNLVKSRVDNVNNRIFKTIDEMEKYSEQTVSNIYYLILEGNGVRNVHADHAASHIGKAQGIVQQLRSIPIARKINFIAIPQDVLTKHNVSHEDILRSKASEALNECTFEVASRAHQHLVKARNLLKDVPIEGRSTLLPATAVENYLNRLQNVQHNPLHASLQHRAWIWLPKLYYKSLKNEY